MDEAPTRRPPEVSCRNLKWSFDLCKKKNIDPQRVLRHVPYPLEHLQDPSRFIDWESYATFISNFSKYFTTDDLLTASRYSWQHSNMRVYKVIGRLLFTLKDQFLAAFGPLGIVVKLYPCEMSLLEIFPGQLSIILKMKPGCTPCHTFHVLLAGQMIGLPESLGYPKAAVEMTPTSEGARYDVIFDTGGGLLAPLRKALAFPFTARAAARELTITYSSLLEKYRELHEETEKLKRAERRALENEERYRLLATKVNDVIWTIDADLEFQYISPSIESLTGFTEKEALELNLEGLLTRSSFEQFAATVKKSLATPEGLGEASVDELILTRKDGGNSYIEVKTGVIADRSGRAQQVISVARDITERKAIERELKEREEGYRVITTSAQDAIVTIDSEYRITLANPATSSIFGYEQDALIGTNLYRLLPGLDPERHFAPRPAGDSGVMLTGVRADGTRVPLEISFAEHNLHGKSHFTGIMRDVTFRSKVEEERKQLEQQLMASQKMESIGQLTGGIAHDFNNLLVAILGYADLGLKKDADTRALRSFLLQIKQAGQRAADMTQKLLAFSRRQIIEPDVININDLFHGINAMIRRLLPEHIDVRFSTADESLNVMADKGQLEQVLINLAVNARDAMPDGGRLNIVAERVRIDAGLSGRATKPCDHVLMRISDTGTGMSEEVRERIFEPFFTTKPEGSGTGLGLAVVFGIIRQHGGFIDVQSEPGQGTSIKIYLPATDEKPETRVCKTGPATSARGGNETLLVVEDNRQVRELARLILRGAGYNVLTAANGGDALDLFHRHAKTIDLAILDVVMPRMGGKEVMRKIREIKPEIRVMFTTGYSASGIHANFILEEGLELIKKPYTTDGLRASVRRVLDEPPSQPSAVS